MSANQQPHLVAAPAPLTRPIPSPSLIPGQTRAQSANAAAIQPRSDSSALGSPARGMVCPSCGGSGMLRMGDQRFRTCLDCLGQGRLPVMAAAPTVAEVLHLDSRRLNAAASSVAAR